MISGKTLSTDFDVVIVGGGLVGASLALALRQSALRIAIIDARMINVPDPRLFGLNYSSCAFLKNLGIWPQLVAHAAPINEVHVSYEGRFGAIRLKQQEVNLPELGHVVPAEFLEIALNTALEQSSQIKLFRPAALQALQLEEDHAVLKIKMADSECELSAKLVIGADGTASTVRKELNVETDIIDYQQSALVTQTLLKRPHQSLAYERFNQQGAIAMLPLNGNRCATIWTADHQTIHTLMALPDDKFLETLQKRFGYRLGKLQGTLVRHVFPLQMVRAKQMVIKQVILLGNAAHTLHPIAAQGLNLALYEVAMLAEKILNTTDIASLNLHEAVHHAQQKKSTGLSHYLASLYSNPSWLLGWALQAGMVGLDLAVPLKRQLIKTMLGRVGHVPHLLLSANDHEDTFSV